MTLIFDFDGTLHQTARIYVPAFRAAQKALAAAGWPTRDYTDAEATAFVGMNLPDMWQRFLPQAPAEVQADGAERIGEALDEGLRHGNAALYPGVPEALWQLRKAGHTLVLLSNCRHSYGEAARERFGLDRWFSGFYFCEDYAYAPKEAIFPTIAAVYPGPYRMIGDRASDKKVADTHHFPFIACAYGYGTKAELEGSAAVCTAADQLPAAIEQTAAAE